MSVVIGDNKVAKTESWYKKSKTDKTEKTEKTDKKD